MNKKLTVIETWFLKEQHVERALELVRSKGKRIAVGQVGDAHPRRADVTGRRSVVLACTFLIALHLAALSAGFLAPYSPSAQNRSFPYAPPTRLHVVDERGRLHLRPFVYALSDEGGVDAAYREDRSQAFPVRLLARDEASGRLHLFGVDEPARLFVLGSDGFGRDQLSRLLHGARVSLLAGLLAGGALWAAPAAVRKRARCRHRYAIRNHGGQDCTVGRHGGKERRRP